MADGDGSIDRRSVLKATGSGILGSIGVSAGLSSIAAADNKDCPYHGFPQMGPSLTTITDTVPYDDVEIQVELGAISEAYLPENSSTTIGAGVFCMLDIPEDYYDPDGSYYAVDNLSIEVEAAPLTQDEAVRVKNANVFSPSGNPMNKDSFFESVADLGWSLVPYSWAVDFFLEKNYTIGDIPPLSPGDPYNVEFNDISYFDQPDDQNPAQCGVELTFEHVDREYPEPGDYRWTAQIEGAVRRYGDPFWKVGTFQDSVGFYTTVEEGDLMHGECLD